VYIQLVDIPGHFIIKGNLLADKYAKDTAYILHISDMVVPKTISVKAEFGKSGEIARKSWQRL